MVSADTAFAFNFNEGPDYLFVADLGEGNYGEAMLVRSCAYPHDLYVRKRVPYQENESNSRDFHDEVRNHRRSKHIPELIDWTSYNECSYAMTLQFRNGGTIKGLTNDGLAGDARPIPEIFVWKVFMQLLETLDYLHCQSKPPVAHCDVFAQNVLLHWPEECLTDGAKDKHHLPDVFLGDFGIAESGKNASACRWDLRQLHAVVIRVCLGKSRADSELAGWKDRFPRCYSAKLRRMAILPEPWNGRDEHQPKDKVPPASVLRERIAPTALRKMAEFMNESTIAQPSCPIKLRSRQGRHSTARKSVGCFLCPCRQENMPSYRSRSRADSSGQRSRPATSQPEVVKSRAVMKVESIPKGKIASKIAYVS